MIICISGKAGSGKSTLGKKLAEIYGLSYISGGDALKKLANSMRYQKIDKGWWETEEGQEFLKERQKTPDFDRKIDEALINMAKKGDVVIDSWTIPWLINNECCFKIWLKASHEHRAKRVSKRDGISLQLASKMIKEKDSRSREIYKALYGFNFGDDFTPFDIVFNNEKFESGEVLAIVCKVVNILRDKDYFK